MTLTEEQLKKYSDEFLGFGVRGEYGYKIYPVYDDVIKEFKRVRKADGLSYETLLKHAKLVEEICVSHLDSEIDIVCALKKNRDNIREFIDNLTYDYEGVDEK